MSDEGGFFLAGLAKRGEQNVKNGLKNQEPKTPRYPRRWEVYMSLYSGL